MLELHVGRDDVLELTTTSGTVEIRVDRIGDSRVDLSIDAPSDVRIVAVPEEGQAS